MDGYSVQLAIGPDNAVYALAQIRCGRAVWEFHGDGADSVDR